MNTVTDGWWPWVSYSFSVSASSSAKWDRDPPFADLSGLLGDSKEACRGKGFTRSRLFPQAFDPSAMLGTLIILLTLQQVLRHRVIIHFTDKKTESERA